MPNSELQDIFENYKPEYNPTHWEKLRLRLSQTNKRLSFHLRYDTVAVMILFVLVGGVYISFQKARHELISILTPVLIQNYGIQAGKLMVRLFVEPKAPAVETPQPIVSHIDLANVDFEVEHSSVARIAHEDQGEKLATVFKDSTEFLVEKLEISNEILHVAQNLKAFSDTIQLPQYEKFSISFGVMGNQNQSLPFSSARLGIDLRVSRNLIRGIHIVGSLQQYSQQSIGLIYATRTLDQIPIPFLSTSESMRGPRTAYTNIPYTYLRTMSLTNFSLGLGLDLRHKGDLRFRAISLLNNTYVNSESYNFQLVKDERLTIPNHETASKMAGFREYYGKDTKVHFANSITLGLSVSRPISKGLHLGIEPFIILPIKPLGVYDNHVQSIGATLRLGYSKNI